MILIQSQYMILNLQLMERDHKYCCSLGMRLATFDTTAEVLEVSNMIFALSKNTNQIF